MRKFDRWLAEQFFRGILALIFFPFCLSTPHYASFFLSLLWSLQTDFYFPLAFLSSRRFLYVYSFSNLPQPVPSDFTYTFSFFPFFFHCHLNSNQLDSFLPFPFLPTTSCVSALSPSFFYFHNGPSRFVIYFAAHLSSSSIFDFCFSLSSEIRHVFFSFFVFILNSLPVFPYLRYFLFFSYFKLFLISSHSSFFNFYHPLFQFAKRFCLFHAWFENIKKDFSIPHYFHSVWDTITGKQQNPIQSYSCYLHIKQTIRLFPLFFSFVSLRHDFYLRHAKVKRKIWMYTYGWLKYQINQLDGLSYFL